MYQSVLLYLSCTCYVAVHTCTYQYILNTLFLYNKIIKLQIGGQGTANQQWLALSGMQVVHSLAESGCYSSKCCSETHTLASILQHNLKMAPWPGPASVFQQHVPAHQVSAFNSDFTLLQPAMNAVGSFNSLCWKLLLVHALKFT